jgi:hypothetical protein
VTDEVHDDGFAAELARCGSLPDRLIALHGDDGTGHCRVCSAGGQAGHLTHPCTLRSVATEALVIQARRRLDRPPDES